MGASLLAKAVCQATVFFDCATAIASRLTPTGSGVGHKSCEQHKTNVVASLLAKAVCQATVFLTGPPPSRAGSLPQGPVSATNLANNIKPMWERACSRKRCVRRQCF
ncbi:hypothetical protein EAH72_03395 [Pseudomonas caspiana]|nr:hypothetical protein EAH72_03395 [Pseudomonas caspiana]